MKAWAINMKSVQRIHIFCVFAKTEAEALGLAFSELAERLEEDNPAEEETSDYSVNVVDSKDFSEPSSVEYPKESFEDQIRASRK